MTLCNPMDCSPPGSSLLFMGCPRQEYRSGVPFPTPGHLPDPGTIHMSHLSSLAGGFFTTEPPGSPEVKQNLQIKQQKARGPYNNRVQGLTTPRGARPNKRRAYTSSTQTSTRLKWRDTPKDTLWSHQGLTTPRGALPNKRRAYTSSTQTSTRLKWRDTPKDTLWSHQGLTTPRGALPNKRRAYTSSTQTSTRLKWRDTPKDTLWSHRHPDSKIRHYKENCRPLSLMNMLLLFDSSLTNIDAKILNKLASQIQQDIKKDHTQ